MEVRFFEIGRDYPDICEWWRAHKWPHIPLHQLPKHGFVVEEDGEKFCAGWLYMSDSALCWMEWIVTNPDSPLRRRPAALNLLVSTVKKVAQELGAEACIVELKSAGLARIVEAHDFVKGDSDMTHYVARFA